MFTSYFLGGTANHLLTYMLNYKITSPRLLGNTGQCITTSDATNSHKAGYHIPVSPAEGCFPDSKSLRLKMEIFCWKKDLHFSLGNMKSTHCILVAHQSDESL